MTQCTPSAVRERVADDRNGIQQLGDANALLSA